MDGPLIYGIKTIMPCYNAEGLVAMIF